MPVPAEYTLDLVGHVATEVWNYPANQNIHCPLCSSIYEDSPDNYLIDYAIVNQGLPGGVPVCSTRRPERRWRDDFFLPIPGSELRNDLSSPPRSSGKYQVPGSGSAST